MVVGANLVEIWEKQLYVKVVVNVAAEKGPLGTHFVEGGS